MPATIAQGGEQLAFGYDSERQRVKQEKPDGTTLYFQDRAGSGIWIEKTTSSLGLVTWTNYIFAGGEGMVAARFETVGGATHTRYFHKDHLGSIQVLTDEAGAVAETLAYDGWGKRRYPNGAPDDGNLPSSATTRGFTGHEELEVGLVHMNGRIYDPQIGRFVSADPMVESPYSTQGWNRYAYVGNNPLAFTDPNGFCFLGCFWKPVLKVAKPIIIVAAVVLAQQYELLPTISVGLTIGGTQVLSATAVNAAFVGAIAGGISGGSVKAAVVGGVTAAAFAGVGDLTGFHKVGWDYATQHLDDFALNIAGHAAVGCASAEAMGGKCGAGAASGAFGAFAAPAVHSLGFQAGLVVSSVAGGVGSVLGGGKFANGAVTGAFGYLFNQALRGVERVPFQQEVESRGFAGYAPNVLGALGNAWSHVVGGLLSFLGPEIPLAEQSFFVGSRYTSKVLEQMKWGDWHSFPEGVAAFEHSGTVSSVVGRDGITRQVLEIPGSYRGKSGVFRWIKEPSGDINHRMFESR